MKYISLFTIIFMVTACSTFQVSKNTDTNKQSNSSVNSIATKPDSAIEKAIKTPATRLGYVIQPGDVLEISVWKEKDLEREVVVRPDGKLTFPLVGDITAAGLTYKKFKESITSKLSRYVPNPVVTVSARSLAGNQVYIIGKVLRPGVYPSNRDLDVMQALTLAGGLNSFASGRSIKILRRENGRLKAIRFNYNKVKKGKKLEQNIMLQSGDVIVVR